MRLFNDMSKREVAVLLLAATAFASITYSLGVYDFTFIDRPDKYFDDDEGDDIIFLCRTGINRPHTYHNTNYSTFHRIKNFRTL